MVLVEAAQVQKITHIITKENYCPQGEVLHDSKMLVKRTTTKAPGLPQNGVIQIDLPKQQGIPTEYAREGRK